MNHPAAECVPLFPEEEIPIILRALIRCCKQLRKKAPREREDHLSNRLYLYLRRDTELRKRPVRPFREVPVYENTDQDDSASESPVGRPDIIFLFSSTAGEWPYFAVECKRLNVAHLHAGIRPYVSEYVGHQGMMCFIDQRYSRGLAHAAMLGYVFDGKVGAARDAVAKAVKNDHAELQAHHQGEMQQSALSIVEIHETHHQIGGRLFILHHLFVPV